MRFKRKVGNITYIQSVGGDFSMIAIMNHKEKGMRKHFPRNYDVPILLLYVIVVSVKQRAGAIIIIQYKLMGSH